MSTERGRGNRRKRANSVISIKDLIKRKRGAEDPGEFEKKQSDAAENEELEAILKKLDDVKEIKQDLEAKITVVKCANFEHKIEKIKQKQKLPSNVYIDSDLIMEERKVQLAIRNVAREVNNNGKRTKIGNRKLEVDGIKFEWSQEQEGFLVRADIKTLVTAPVGQSDMKTTQAWTRAKCRIQNRINSKGLCIR
ncbi:hypothetical protein FQA39_LY13911 [Lamprigera yunnana]|nr:hypothetical protein FQA39_LY13911 [Lamprigera yunnana]